MSSRYFVFATACAWLLALTTPCAHAFVDPPTLAPTHPVAGQAISVSVRIGECDGFTLRTGYPKITRSGNAIRIILPAVHISNGLICYVPDGTQQFSVGAFPAGNYTLQVDRIYDRFFGGDVVETLGTLPFTVTVTRQATTAVPALTRTGIALLIAAILAAGCITTRRRPKTAK